MVVSSLAQLKKDYDAAKDDGRRADLLRAAADLREPGVASFLAHIAQADTPIALRAATALGAVTDPAAGAELLAIVQSASPTLVRANAARALATSGGPEQVQGLAAAAGDNRQPLRLRQEAALALGHIGEASALPALIAILEHDPNEQLRISAVQALAKLDSSEARAFLGEYAKRNLSTSERAFVARAESH
jgi:HEAT repeat protein